MTQLVEWLIVNQHVTGSSPVGGVQGSTADYICMHSLLMSGKNVKQGG